jgi:hypothetical protein
MIVFSTAGFCCLDGRKYLARVGNIVNCNLRIPSSLKDRLATNVNVAVCNLEMEEYPMIKTFYAKFSNQMKALFQQFCTVL